MRHLNALGKCAGLRCEESLGPVRQLILTLKERALMSATLDRLSDTVGREAAVELDSAVRVINHCLDQLDNEHVWWRPAESMNSIANLLLHLCGNLRQWIVAGVGGADDIRERQKEFDDRSSAPKADLIRQLEDAVAEVKSILSNVSPDELLRIRRIQGNSVTGLQAILHSLAHFRGHTQEIVHITRCQLGDKYQFDFVPRNAEQGASQE